MSSPRLTLRLLVLLILPPLMWAGNAVVGRLAIDLIDPLWLNALRWLLALLILLPLGWRAIASAAARQAIRQRWKYLAILGLLGIGTYNALQYLALRTSSPLNVTLIASSMPVWTLLIGALVYGVHPTRLQFIGTLVSLAGVAAVLSRGNLTALLSIRLVEGDLLMVLAIIGWSIYSWMLAKPPPHMQPGARPDWNWAEFLLVQCLFGVCWNFATTGIGESISPSPPADWSWPLLLALAFIAIGPSVMAYRAWGLAVAEAGPGLAAVFYNFTPLLAAILSAAVMGEWPQLYHGLAFILIVAGILISTRSLSQRE